MNENISVEGTCCTHSLNETLRCVISDEKALCKLLNLRSSKWPKLASWFLFQPPVKSRRVSPVDLTD
jgi:hypothetical protein